MVCFPCKKWTNSAHMHFLLPAKTTDMMPRKGATILLSWESNTMEDESENQEEPQFSVIPLMLIMLPSGLLIYMRNKALLLSHCWSVSIKIQPNITLVGLIGFKFFRAMKNQSIASVEMLSPTKDKILTLLCVVQTVELIVLN